MWVTAAYKIYNFLTNVENSNASLAIRRAAPERNATLERKICAIIAITAMPREHFQIIIQGMKVY